MSKELAGIVKAWEATVRKSQAAAKKRASSIFATMSVAHVDDDLIDAAGAGAGDEVLSHTEEMFPNGDIYIGQWSCTNNWPHGPGKLVWSDGCMYVGDWFKGKEMGKGRFSWPSGATYEGQFKGGFMDGEGTYTGSLNDTYRGSWVMNMKHGRGSKDYANGDHYDGDWRRGLPDGHGRYHWHNGNQYIGHWKSGVMNGNGTIIWANGNRYDGCWEDGMPKGNGTYRWGDGSFYVGVWSKDPKEHNGIFYPSHSSENSSDEWDPQQVYTTELRDCVVSEDENIKVFPSQKPLNWQTSDDLPTHHRKPSRKNSNSSRQRRLSVDGRLSNGGSGVASWGSESDVINGYSGQRRKESDDENSDASRGMIRIQAPKRQGETICKGHKNYDLMLNLQLGIRHSVGRPAKATSLDLKPTAFDTREKVWTKFPPGGSKHTPPHQSCDFKWKDYCPLVFRTLRRLFNVDPADYMLSICGNDALRELSSPGKSGSFFYLTHDDKYMIKTMKKSEVKVLKRMLPAYFDHVKSFEHTLVTKFFGLHCVKLTGTAQKKVRFVIMGNLFCTEYAIHRRFDLKGSSHGRTTDKAETEIEATTTLKDLDLNFIFRLQKDWFQEFCRQVDRDCDFLEQERIMDYSLLIGLHFRGNSHNSSREPNAEIDSEGGAAPRLTSSESDPTPLAAIKLGISMPSRVERTVRSYDNQLVGDPTGEYYDVILFFGIIDILQDYDISKKLEHAYKSIQYDPTSISAVDPGQYSKRFREFIFKVFSEDT